MLKYWLWLTSLPGLSLRDQTLLLRHFGAADEVYFAGNDALSMVDGLSERARETLQNKTLDTAERLLSECFEKNIAVYTMQDAIYPARLRAIDQPPPVLYCVGRMLPFDTQPTIAVVGTRSTSAYGLRTAKRMGYQIGRCGGAVVSGMARGIDAMAMEGALSAGAPVAGVLGCGVDVVYPRENRGLFHDVVQWGCLLSEYPPGTPPISNHFPQRNRILSALALGTLIVEAPEKSGALITAGHALEQGRDVYAVPGNIDNLASVGANQLIRDGALLVTNGWEVMRDYAPLFPGKLRYQPGGQQLDLSPSEAEEAAAEQKREKTDGEAKNLPNTEKAGAKRQKSFDKMENKPYIELDSILSQVDGDERELILLLAEKPLTADELIDRSQIPANRVMASLTLLEVQGLIRCSPDKRMTLTGASD